MSWIAFQVLTVIAFAIFGIWLDPLQPQFALVFGVWGLVFAFFLTGLIVYTQNLICWARLWRTRRRAMSQDGVHQSLTGDSTEGSGFTRLPEPADGGRGRVQDRSRQRF